MAAETAELFATGGAGDDVLTGSALRDHLEGGLGDDHLWGRGSTDRMFGHEGDDSISWSGPGDGIDQIVGGPGADEVFMWTTDAAEIFELRPASEGVEVTGGTLPARLVAATTEKLYLSAGGGDDHIHADQVTHAVALSLDGGAGDDHITGGAGRDNVKGGLDQDNVGGGDGDDLVSGELAFGDRGNDRITVEKGVKGIAEGGDGVDVAYVGTGVAADTVSVRPSLPNVRVDGQAGDAPFAVSVRNSEALYVDTGDGDDSATIAPGTGALISTLLRGGRGNDTLRGSDGLETLAGDFGADTLDGGLAPDRLLGGYDDDTILARDGADDEIECATGFDSVLADLEPSDRLTDGTACERVGRAAPTEAREPSASIGEPGELTDDGHGIVGVPISCPPVRGGCRGTLTLVSAQPLAVGASGSPMRVTLGSAPFLLGPGSRGELPVSIPGHADLLPIQHELGGRLPARAQVLTGVAEGAPAERTTDLSLSLLR